jgi:hypothetical protein
MIITCFKLDKNSIIYSIKTTIARGKALSNNQPTVGEAEMLLVASGQRSALPVHNYILLL